MQMTIDGVNGMAVRYVRNHQCEMTVLGNIKKSLRAEAILHLYTGWSTLLKPQHLISEVGMVRLKK